MDDFGFGTDVWATPSNDIPRKSIERLQDPTFPSFSTSSKTPTILDEADPFDANEDFSFNTPVQPLQTNGDDDDFGDFGEFDEAGDGVAGTLGSFSQDEDFGGGVVFQSFANDWDVLHLDPLPSTSQLKGDIERILQPLWQRISSTVNLSDDNIRQVGGINQTLVTHESRALHTTLFQMSPPDTHPPNWTRSRIRRRHLVSLGIPVNLDEVLPHAGGRPMPALQITTRPMSAPPGPRLLNNGSNPRIDRIASPPPGSGSVNNSRAGTPVPGRSPLARNSTAPAQAGFGPKPVLDELAIERILGYTQNDLTLLPLQTLESQLASLKALTANASAVLTHLLQARDALQQDSETYNGLIAELVGEAQKIKPGAKSRTGQSRRASGMT